MLKSDISDHFHSHETFIKRRNIDTEATQEYRQILSLVHCDFITKLLDANAAFRIVFPEQKVKTKIKTHNSPWITKSLQRSSKRKQKFIQKVNERKKQNQGRKIQDI